MARRGLNSLIYSLGLPDPNDLPKRRDCTGETLYSPVKNERRLALMCGATVKGTDVCLRRWLWGRFPDRPYKHPFELVITHSSQSTYRKELKRCLPSFMGKVEELRAAVHPDEQWEGGSSGEEDEDEDKNEDNEDDEDDDEVEKVHDERDMNEDEKSDAESLEEQSLSAPSSKPDDQAVDILLRFCYFMVTEDFEHGIASSTMLVYFSAVRGLANHDGHKYLQPERFTPILARFIYFARSFSRGIASRPRYRQLEILKASRQAHMCDGTLSPMGEFLSLLSYGHVL
ncbi:hypothetical protein BGZ63DRAFT_417761 [Mariannaea sp. PMI_226]|nr:hypothetical protein BGZ63DRAFT_417761 [Mariannaea sp. PMI_226]